MILAKNNIFLKIYQKGVLATEDLFSYGLFAFYH